MMTGKQSILNAIAVAVAGAKRWRVQSGGATNSASTSANTRQDCPCDERPTTGFNLQQLPIDHMSENH